MKPAGPALQANPGSDNPPTETGGTAAEVDQREPGQAREHHRSVNLLSDTNPKPAAWVQVPGGQGTIQGIAFPMAGGAGWAALYIDSYKQTYDSCAVCIVTDGGDDYGAVFPTAVDAVIAALTAAVSTSRREE